MVRTFAATLILVGVIVGSASVKAGEAAADLALIMADVNRELAEQDVDYRVVMAEYMTVDEMEQANTVLSKDVGNKQLSFDFVPFDGRRAWSGVTSGPDDDITYAVDMTIDAVPPIGGLSAAATDEAIDRAMATWDAQTCSNLPITQNPDFGIDIGVVAFLNGLGGTPFVFADVQHAGWRFL